MLFSFVDDSFCAPIGKLLLAWSLFETHLNDLVFALLKRKQATATGWRGQGFSKREELLKKEWNEFIKADSNPSRDLSKVLKDKSGPKILREHLAHDQIFSGLDNMGKNWVAFKSGKARQASKRYELSDISGAEFMLSRCTGLLSWMRSHPDQCGYTSDEISLIRTLPDTETSFALKPSTRPRPPLA